MAKSRKLINHKFKVGDIISMEYGFDVKYVGVIMNIGNSYEGITVRWFQNDFEVDYNHSHAIKFFKVL